MGQFKETEEHRSKANPGKITVTVACEDGTQKDMKDQNYVLVIGGKRQVEKRGTWVSLGIVGELSAMDMFNAMRCLCEANPLMRAAVVMAAKEELNKSDFDSTNTPTRDDIQEMDLDDFIRSVLSPKDKEQ